MQGATWRDKGATGHDEDMEKESSLQVPPSVLAEACRKWIFGGYLVTPDPRDAIHVTSRRPVTSP